MNMNQETHQKAIVLRPNKLYTTLLNNLLTVPVQAPPIERRLFGDGLAAAGHRNGCSRSSAMEGRAKGSRRKQLRRKDRRSGSTPPSARLSLSGILGDSFEVAMWRRRLAALSAPTCFHGGWPVAMFSTVPPMLHTSASKPCLWPVITSGAMKYGVPLSWYDAAGDRFSPPVSGAPDPVALCPPSPPSGRERSCSFRDAPKSANLIVPGMIGNRCVLERKLQNKRGVGAEKWSIVPWFHDSSRNQPLYPINSKETILLIVPFSSTRTFPGLMSKCAVSRGASWRYESPSMI